jgi:nitrate reductase NapE component
MYCTCCGKELPKECKYCDSCGTSQNNRSDEFNITFKRRKKWTAFFLCLVLGMFGVHRFYVGKYGTGILWMFTFGCFYLGWIIDCISILRGTFSDINGFPLV